MTCPSRHFTASSGYALLVVLSTLAILTLLFAISSAQSLSHLQYQRAELNRTDRDFRDTEILKAIIERGDIEDIRISGGGSVSVGGALVQFEAVDVGGLVDLNAAAPPLLEALFASFSLGADEVEAFRAWRQQSRRLLRVSDLGRIVDAEIPQGELKALATVYSGRQGVSLDHVPLALEDSLAPLVDLGSFTTPASNASFVISLRNQHIGVVFFTPSGPARILELK